MAGIWFLSKYIFSNDCSISLYPPLRDLQTSYLEDLLVLHKFFIVNESEVLSRHIFKISQQLVEPEKKLYIICVL
jgi:hypothetical protein